MHSGGGLRGLTGSDGSDGCGVFLRILAGSAEFWWVLVDSGAFWWRSDGSDGV